MLATSCRIFYRMCSSHTASEAAATLIGNSSRILVMAGAGLSTPSGIPDFRSPGTGIYDNLQQYNLPYPEAIFDINYFRYFPEPFYIWAKEFFPGINYHPNCAHRFIKVLNDGGKLLRLFTQNIDGLELLAGISKDKLVFAHGSFTGASCIDCGQTDSIENVKASILNETGVPRCRHCGGYIKPDIVFFGENLPDRFFRLKESDTDKADLLVCIGTSLEVYPFAGLADEIPRDTPRILINREVVGTFGYRENDVILTGDLVENVDKLAKLLAYEIN